MNQPASILVVDDVAANRETLRELLDAPHYGVVEAADGPTALRLAAESPPDLVLLDVMMPGMDGYEVCRRLRANVLLAEVPVVMVTALDDQASRLAGIEAGADDFIAKPFNRIELRARVRTITRLNRYRRLMDAQDRIHEQARWLDAAHDAIFVCDMEDRITYWNDGATRLFGWTAKEALGRIAAELMHDETIPFDQELLRAVHSASDWQGEVRKPTKAGREVFVASRLTPLRDSRGEPCGVLCINTDITERKHAEAALWQSRTVLQQVLDTVPQSIFWKDKASVYLGCNRVFARAVGLTDSEQIAGKTDFDLSFPKEQAEAYRTDDALVIASGAPRRNIVEQLRQSDGSELWINTQRMPMADAHGRVQGILGIYDDITESKHSQDQLREQVAMLDAAPDGIILKDLDGRILFWNQGAERLFGWEAVEAVGQNVRQLLFSNAAKCDEAMGALLHEGHWRGELLARTKEGRVLTMDARWTQLLDEAGRTKSILSINTDITERKKLEAQFLRVQRMESIGTLAGGIAHDLNNVLAPILLSVELLEGKVNDPAGRAILATLQTSARHGADLVKQVLSFARGVEGKRILIDAVHLVRDLQHILRDTFPKNIQLRFNLGRRLWTMLGDPTQIYQVFMNLCVNARDAMLLGGTLSVTMQNTVVDEVFAGMNPEAKPGAYVLVTVTDTGTGVPPDVQERIFEPFFTTKDLAHGTGLGLATVLTIIKSHGGFIRLDSEVGVGTTFRVYLPASQSVQNVEAAPEPPAQLPVGHGELVLVVDDEVGVRDIAMQVLERFGYRVLLASHGAEAVALYASRRDQVAVVLTDMAMPIMDGPVTIVALKAMNPEVKIIASSGLAYAGWSAKALATGVRHFIPKPYTAKVLLETLAQVLREERGA